MNGSHDMNLVAALPEVVLAAAAMALLLFGVFRGDRSTGLVAWIAVGIAAVTLVLVLVLAAGAGTEAAFGGLFVTSAFTVFVKALVLLGSALCIVMAMDYFRREDMYRFEYPVLMLFAALGMMMMVSADDLIALYLGLELQSLSLYVLAAFRRDTLRSTEAGLKYFVLGALASGMLLYGCSMVYGFSGTTDFGMLAAAFADGSASAGVIVGLVFIAAGFAFKISAVPFHMWTPDVYEGAPTPVTAFFAVAPKVAALALFMRLLVEPFGELVGEWRQIVVVVAVGSMLLGAFAAIAQRNIKRLMAYSSIGHMGYALVGLAAGDEQGVRAVLIYLAVYMFMTLGTFACILSMRQQGRMVEEVSDLSGLSRTHPLMAACLAALMFSMAGIPPLAGFWGKLYVFQAAIGAGLIPVAVIGVLASVVGCFYYIRIVKLMYFDDVTEALDGPIGREMAGVLAISTAVVVLFILYPSPIVSNATAAAAALFPG